MVPYRRIPFKVEPWGGSPAPTPASAHDSSLFPPASPPVPIAVFPPPFSLGFDNRHNRRIANLLLIGAAVIAAVLLLSLTYYTVLRRRRRRRPPRAAALAGPGNDDDASLGDGDPVHHVWYIRTVGLDESTISSIAVAEYRTGDALLDGASNCSVCLGEFHDGERVRLLPKCGHVFHVPCIDTWLRAHVNCPLCRAHVVDSDSDSAPPSADALAASVTISGGSVESDSDSSSPAEIPQIGVPPVEERNEGLHNAIGIGIRVSSYEAYDSQPESSSSREQSALIRHGLPPVRRSASMGEPLMNSIIGRFEPEQRFIDKEGEDASFGEGSAPTGNSSKGVMDQRGQSDMKRSLSSNGMGFFFSRHGRVARIHSMPL